MITNLTNAQLYKVIELLDRIADEPQNIDIKDWSSMSTNRTRFTLTIRTSRDRYATRNPVTGRWAHALCWHGHAAFFDKVFSMYPDAFIRTSMRTADANTIVYNAENSLDGYRDWRKGSEALPYMASECCECQ